MTKGRRQLGEHMRPNIQISHQLNGRVKDYAAENDMTVDEAYREIIEAGLDVLEEENDSSNQ